jgi:hypothetical protein
MMRAKKAALVGPVVMVVLGTGFFACSSASRPGAETGPTDSGKADTGVASEGGSVDTGTHDTGAHDAPADGVSDGVAPLDGGDAAPGPEAGDEGGGGPPPPAAICSMSATWMTGTLLTISTSSDDELDAVTPNELSLVWSVGPVGTATLEYVDRAAVGDAFGPPQTVPAGSFATDRAALSPDGLRLVVVNSDGQGFSELTRTSQLSPGNTFGAPGVGTYGNLNGILAAGESYGDPVLSADDHTFYYSVYGGSLTATIFRTSRLFAGDSWPAGAALPASSGLAAQGSLRRRPTGISSDDQTLFFFDEVMGTERAAWISESTGAYDMFVDLGIRTMAAPNTACSTLYYSAAGASTIDLFSAAN